MVPSMINIGHRDVAITEEINASQDARWRQLEAAEARKSARSKSPQDGISPAPPPKPPKPKPEQPKPKPAKTPAPGSPALPRVRRGLRRRRSEVTRRRRG